METPLASTHAFLAQLLDSGGTIVRIAENLVAALEEHGSSHDEAITDIFQMMVGTTAARFASTPDAEIARATELIALTLQAVLEDLERAVQLTSRRRRAPRAAASAKRSAHRR